MEASTSPERQIAQLRTARPPIYFRGLAATAACVPAAVVPRIQALQTRLHHRLETEFIPACLKDALERDPTFTSSLRFSPIEDTAYYSHEEEEIDAVLVLDYIKAVHQGTKLCLDHGMDENAWCLHVVTPLLQLAIILHGRGRFRQENVQSQSIEPVYLSNIASRSNSAFQFNSASQSSKPIPVFRKTDFCLSYSHLHPPYASLYESLRQVSISHTTDVFTETAALFTGIEVRSLSCNLLEAELQMGIWMAASLRKKAELAWYAFETGALSRPPDHATFIEPGITVIGNQHKVYYAYLSEPKKGDLSKDTSTSSCAVVILGEDSGFPSLNTSSLQGVLRAARLYGNIMEYAADENVETGYWGAFFKPALESLAAVVGGSS